MQEAGGDGKRREEKRDCTARPAGILVVFRACLFGLWLAGCAGKAAVQVKQLF
jgi:hypothetical protein